MGGRTSHCFSSCHSQQQSCINKNVLKSVIFLSLGMLTGQIICQRTRQTVVERHSCFYGHGPKTGTSQVARV